MSKLIFISHSTEDLSIAKDVKSLLRIFGLDGFVAHVDIELSQDWIAKIVESLRKCDGLVYLLSTNAQLSDWTDQEVGFALNREIPVIPMSIDVRAWGFVSRFQAKRWISSENQDEYGRLKPNARNLGIALIENKLLSVNELIKAFGSSTTFTDAILRQIVLDRVSEFSYSQVTWILDLVASNENLYKCVPVRNWIPRLLTSNRGAVSHQVRTRFREVGIRLS